jgi:protein kinase
MHKICSVFGTPTEVVWPEGLALASKMSFQFPRFAATPLAQLIPNASREAIQLMGDMMKYHPKKRCTCTQALQYPYFQVGANVPTGNGGLLGLDVSSVTGGGGGSGQAGVPRAPESNGSSGVRDVPSVRNARYYPPDT